MDNNLTSNNQEIRIKNVLNNNTQIHIPLFQRNYRWTDARNLQPLLRDLTAKIDDDDPSPHFMGALLAYEAGGNSTLARRYYLIDGQQRMTTLILLLAAIAKVQAELGFLDDAASTTRAFLVLEASATAGQGNSVLIPSRSDARSMNRVLRDLLRTNDLENSLPNERKYVPLRELSGGSSKRVENAYKVLRRWVSDRVSEGSGIIGEQKRLLEVRDRLLERLTFVEIFIKDPLDGPMIFDRLNSKGESLTIAELVKNAIFSRGEIANLDELEAIDNNYWEPFLQKFRLSDDEKENERITEGYFFPYALVKDSSSKKSDLYRVLQDSWSADATPAELLADLASYQDDYLAIIAPDRNARGFGRDLVAALESLRRAAPIAAHLPFSMRLSNEVAAGALDEAQATQCVRLVESYLVRRALCGIEPTGLHAVFKVLWRDAHNDQKRDLALPLASRVWESLLEHGTQEPPTDDDVRESIATRDLYGSRVTAFVLTELDRAETGDNPNINATVEHLLPQNPDEDSPWWLSWSEQDHALLKDTLGNLTVLSQSLNASLQAGPWNIKRARIQEESAFATSRALAGQHEEWTPLTWRARTEHLSEWVVNHWPVPDR